MKNNEEIDELFKKGKKWMDFDESEETDDSEESGEVDNSEESGETDEDVFYCRYCGEEYDYYGRGESKFCSDACERNFYESEVDDSEDTSAEKLRPYDLDTSKKKRNIISRLINKFKK